MKFLRNKRRKASMKRHPSSQSKANNNYKHDPSVGNQANANSDEGLSPWSHP